MISTALACSVETAAVLPPGPVTDSGTDGAAGDSARQDADIPPRPDTGPRPDSGGAADTAPPGDTSPLPDSGSPPMDSAARPDTSPPPDTSIPRDTSPPRDTSMPPTCDSQYGSAPGYILCDTGPSVCEFFTDLDRTRDCAGTCASRGGTCIEQWRNSTASGGECTRADPSPRPCNVTDINDDICVCTL